MNYLDNKTNLALLIIVVLTLCVFLPVLQNDFVNWDDDEYVTQNKLIQSLSPENIKNIFLSNLTGKYHPLTILTYAIEYQLVELRPFLYHLTNLILHLVNTVLVFMFVCLLLQNAQVALGAAFLFGIHPLQVEPVAWVSSRKDVLFLSLYLLGAISYLKSFTENAKAQRLRALTYLFFILSLLSKAMAITFPLVLILIDYYRQGVFRFKSILQKWPFLIISLSHGLLTLSLAGQTAAFPNTEIYPFWERVLYSFLALTLYIVKVVIPYPLSCFYALKISWPVVVLSVAAVVLGTVLIVITFRRSTLVKFCFLFFLFTVWPILHLFEMNDSIIYERFMYLPSIGFFILISYGLNQLIQRRLSWLKIAGVSIFIVWVVALINLSHRQTRVWNNSATLWNNVIEHFPDAYPAYNNMGTFLEQQYRFDEAMQYFMKMIEVEPRFAEGYFKLANLLALKFDRVGAIRYYSKALEYNAEHYKAYNNRGNQYLLSQMYDLALNDYNEALKLKKDYKSAYLNRGMVHLALKDYARAAQDFKEVLRLEPSNQRIKEKLLFIQQYHLK